MMELTFGFAIFTVALGLFTWRHAKATESVVFFAVLLAAAYLTGAAVLGRPKPISLEFMQANEVAIISFVLDEPKAIYLWLMLEEPRAYVIPWSKDTAKNLREAQRGAAALGTQMMMRRPFAWSSFSKTPRFHAKPQEAYPPK